MTILDARHWGWKDENGNMTPIKTDAEPAPEWLLKVVRKTHAELQYVHEETTESSA